MLFIYSELAIGGIQTFFVRMAKARHAIGKKTKILIIQNRDASNPELLVEAMKYADVYFLEDIVAMPRLLVRFFPKSLLLMMPLKKERIDELLNGIDHAHVSNSVYGFFYLKMSKMLDVLAKLSLGVYHAREFLWDFDGYTPYYQKANKMLFMHNSKSQIFFNEKVLELYRDTTKKKLADVNLFPIGVVESRDVDTQPLTLKENPNLCIGSIGRLVSFKSYNLWMLDLVKELIDKGYKVTYIIYGSGPLEQEMRQKIEHLRIADHVEMRGVIGHQDIDGALEEFDLFVGSGTSIVEASAKGIPSIVGIESVNTPLTYGFLSDIPGFTYHEDGLYPKYQVMEIIEEFKKLNDEKMIELKRKHIQKAKLFSMKACVDNFSLVNPPAFETEDLDRYTGIVFRLRYSISNFIIPRVYLWLGRNPAKLIYG